MIQREYVNCATCNCALILRIQIGHSPKQVHRFHCPSCKEEIQISLDLNQAEGYIESINLEVNCVPGKQENGTPMYLSPDFLADAENINSEFYLPSLNLIEQLRGSKHAKSFFRSLDHPKPPLIETLWEPLKKAWRLQSASQFLLSNSINDAFSKEYGTEAGSLRENLSWFLDGLFPTPNSLFSEIEEIRSKNPKEFLRFLHYYQIHLEAVHFADYYENISSYFDLYMDFSQALIYVKADVLPPAGAIAITMHFEKTKKFYATLYEFYSGAICILTALNNIKEGRPFDRLLNITLDEFRRTDKAKRRNSFEKNSIFTAATAEFDSAIRNASFHNWFKLLGDKSEIEYRSGGTGAIQKISYAKYLYKCNRLFRQMCELMSLELVFRKIACDVAFVTKYPN